MLGFALDPQGPATGSGRVIRGGGWDYWCDCCDAEYCRSAARHDYGSPESWGGDVGFRAVLAPGQ